MQNMYEVVLRDLENRQTSLYKPHKEGIAAVVSAMLVSQTPNLMILGEMLGRKINDRQDRYQYVRRLIANPKIRVDEVMQSYVIEVMERLSKNGETLLLMMDQSKMGDELECLMVSIRFGDRALPVLWRVQKTEGNIGFEIQKELLEAVLTMIPNGVRVMLLADRFYGGSSLVAWCKKQTWQYRIRLKGNLHFEHQGGLIVSGECLKMGLTQIQDAFFQGTSISTHIGIIHEPNHPEPWIIAMGCKPSDYTTLDYGLRWGIEAMFSDYKSRGFGIRETHLAHPDRLERLILIMSIALFWAVSTGLYDENLSEDSIKKNAQDPLFHSLLADYALF